MGKTSQSGPRSPLFDRMLAQGYMATAAGTYGFGARVAYATPRASKHDMKKGARQRGRFPSIRNKPLSRQLPGLLKEFEQNATLTSLLERRRALEGRSQYNLEGQEAMDTVNQNLAPWARVWVLPSRPTARRWRSRSRLSSLLLPSPLRQQLLDM